MSIYNKLLEIQKQVDYLTKDKDGHNYRYVTGTKVLGTIRPLMNQHGLILKQEITEAKHEVITYATKYAEKTEVLAKVMFKFTWVDCESGETDSNFWAADGMNGFDKGIGSAMTYAERYFLLKYFHIPTDELDNDSLGEKAGEKKPDNKPTEKPADTNAIVAMLMNSSSGAELKAKWDKLTPAEKKIPEVLAAKEEKKKELQSKNS